MPSSKPPFGFPSTKTVITAHQKTLSFIADGQSREVVDFFSPFCQNLFQTQAIWSDTAGTYGEGAYSAPPRALLSIDSPPSLGSGQLFGARRLLATLPFVSKLVTLTCNEFGQQAEPACVQQGKCAHCFQKGLTDIGLQADISMVSRQACFGMCNGWSWSSTYSVGNSPRFSMYYALFLAVTMRAEPSAYAMFVPGHCMCVLYQSLECVWVQLRVNLQPYRP